MIDQSARISFNEKVAQDTFVMGLESPAIVARARPGQFVMVRVREGTDPLLRRPFSICATVRDRLLLLLYRVVGQGTAIMSLAEEGERLSILGPLGRGFLLPSQGERAVLVAGGIGLAPLVFLAQTIGDRSTELLVGYGSEGQVVDMENFPFPGVASMSIATDDGSAGHHGPVTDLLEDRLGHREKGVPVVFTCGPKPMLKKVASVTLGRRVTCQASLESFMACGLGACQSCALRTSSGENKPYCLVCQDGPVFDAKAINWENLK